MLCPRRALHPDRGRGIQIGWGFWVQIDDRAYWRIVTLWDDPGQAAEPPFPCTIANDVPNYPGTRGLPGVIRLTGPDTRPSLTLAADCEHAFAVEARTGVAAERALVWRSWFVHGTRRDPDGAKPTGRVNPDGAKPTGRVNPAVPGGKEQCNP